MMGVKSRLKELMHIHKYRTLLIYPPRKQYDEEEYGFLLKCACGDSKLTKLPGSVREVYWVKYVS